MRQMVEIASSVKNPESVITGIRSIWEVLDMSLGGTAEVDDAAAQERDEISRAACAFHLLAEGHVAVVGWVRLRPSHQALDLGGIEVSGDVAGGPLHIHRYAVAIR